MKLIRVLVNRLEGITGGPQAYKTVQEQIKYVDNKRKIICGGLICIFILGLFCLGDDPAEVSVVLDSGKKVVYTSRYSHQIAKFNPDFTKIGRFDHPSNKDFIECIAYGILIPVPSGTSCIAVGEPHEVHSSLKANAHGYPGTMVQMVEIDGETRYVAAGDIKRVGVE